MGLALLHLLFIFWKNLKYRIALLTFVGTTKLHSIPTILLVTSAASLAKHSCQNGATLPYLPFGNEQLFQSRNRLVVRAASSIKFSFVLYVLTVFAERLLHCRCCRNVRSASCCASYVDLLRKRYCWRGRVLYHNNYC
jgi:hypothetical protein